LYVKLELRAMTKKPRYFDRLVMMSSVMPSEKYSCSASPDMFWNASTAIEGLSGSGRACAPSAAGRGMAAGAGWDAQHQILIGRAMFLTVCSPASRHSSGSRSRTS
jgi:hypothetical protein